MLDQNHGDPSFAFNIAGQALRALFRVYEWLKTFDREARGRNLRYSLKEGPDGLPVPPDTLRVRVAGIADIESFLHGGRLAAQTVRELLAAWHRPGEPPASYADERFDAIYAFSVFTHMPADTQRRWLEEFRRLLRPGGLLIFSTHGRHYLSRLSYKERRQFLSGQIVIRFAVGAGSNLCNAYHPEAFVRRELSPGWNVLALIPEGARGNPCQDAWVFQRPR